MGLGRAVHGEQLASGLPDDLARDFERLSAWARTLRPRFGDRVTVHLIDAVSIEGFVKSLVRRVGRYPAWSVGGRRYVGSDFSRVDALIEDCLADTAGSTSRVRKGGGAG